MVDEDRDSSSEFSESDATTTVVAHGLMNVMSVVRATAATLRDNYEDLVEQPGVLREALERMARNADLAVWILEDMTRGLPSDVVTALDETRR